MRCERAKIFAPFSPLRGMDEAYRKKEAIFTPKAYLLEDRKVEIDRVLKMLCIGDTVEITYYCDGNYKTRRGTVDTLSQKRGFIVVGEPIGFDDIYNIEIMGDECFCD